MWASYIEHNVAAFPSVILALFFNVVLWNLIPDSSLSTDLPARHYIGSSSIMLKSIFTPPCCRPRVSTACPCCSIFTLDSYHN